MSIEKGSSKYGSRENGKEDGILPKDAEEMARAESVDLVTLPDDVKGTNCSNCKFIQMPEKFCGHPKVQMSVNERMCCALWDAEGTYRPWKENS